METGQYQLTDSLESLKDDAGQPLFSQDALRQLAPGGADVRNVREFLGMVAAFPAFIMHVSQFDQLAETVKSGLPDTPEVHAFLAQLNGSPRQFTHGAGEPVGTEEISTVEFRRMHQERLRGGDGGFRSI